MKRFFYLGTEKLVRLFVQNVLKGAGHDVYITDSLDDLYVVQDLDSQVVIIDALVVEKLPATFFEKPRDYILLGTEEELKKVCLSAPHRFLVKPISRDDLLSL